MRARYARLIGALWLLLAVLLGLGKWGVSGAAAAPPAPQPMPTLPPLEAWRPPLYPVPWAPTWRDHFFFARPLAAPFYHLPVTDYRYGGVFFQDQVHTGIDIPGELGTPVLAVGWGEVIWAGYGLGNGHPGQPGPYGLAVMLRHDFGWRSKNLYTLYAHLSEVDVQPGWRVAPGTILGRMGNSGHVTGPHLHFEVRLGVPGPDGKISFETRNPELWLAPPLGHGLIVGQVLGAWGRPLPHATVFLVSLEDKDFHWRTYTYAHHPLIYSDVGYRENYVFGDLPAGRYRVTVDYYGRFVSQEMEVAPGRVTFFRFAGWRGFQQKARP